MFQFLKAKPAEDFISDIIRELGRMPNDKKLQFITKKFPAIDAALNSLTPPPFFVETVGAESSTNFYYLMQHNNILTNLYDEKEPNQFSAAALQLRRDQKRTSQFSEAAQYFIEKTEKTAHQNFSDFFDISPIKAITYLGDADLYEETLLTKMAGLLEKDESKLYLKTLDHLSDRHPLYHDAMFQCRLGYYSSQAIAKVLEAEDGLDFLVTSTYGFENALNDDDSKRMFAEDNIDLIDAKFRTVAKTADARHFKKLDGLYNAFRADELPEKLVDLKKLMLAEQLKSCFALAADQTSNLDAVAEILASQEAALEQVNYLRTIQSDTTGVRILHLKNPTTPFETGDIDYGQDSPNLWVVEEDKTFLAASFTAAGLRNYLQVQRAIPGHKMPSMEEFDAFADLKTPQVA